MSSGPAQRSGLRTRAALVRSALGNRRLGLLMASWFVWIAGEWAFLVTMSVLAFDRGGAAAVGLIGAARVLPGAALGPLLTAAWQRLRRPVVIAAVHGCWAAVCVGAALLAAADAALVTLLALTAVGSVLGAELRPSLHTLLPQVLDQPRELVPANTASSTVEGAATILGPLAAGAFLAWLGPIPTFLVLVGAYVLGAIVSALIRTEIQPGRPTGRGGLRLLAPLRAASVLVASPGIRATVALFVAQTMVRGLLNVYVVLLALSVFTGGEAQAGSLFAAVGAGGVAGLLVALGAPPGARTARWFTAGILLWGAPLVVIGLWPDPIVAYAALVALGLGNAIEDIFGYSLLNRLIPDHDAAPAWLVLRSTFDAALGLGSLLAPLLVGALSLSAAMAVTGGALILLAAALWPAARTVDSQMEVDPATVDLFAGIALFAPMSQIGLERLARAAQPREFAAAQVVVGQGEPADGYYLVAEGLVTVSVDRHDVRRMGPGEGFGEIALLKEVRRTATVVATEATRLFVVEGEAFVAAVTGHRGAERAGHQTVEEYLGPA